MNVLWPVLLLFSVISAICTGKTAALSAAVLEGAQSGITLAVSLAGPLCLWSGAANVMADTGATAVLANLFSPFLRHLFPNAWQNPTAREALCGNLSANVLGLGNAATPLGIRAVRAMADGSGIASDELCRLVVLNTASIQLLPTTVAALRAAAGCRTPFDILPAVWITSLCSVSVGLLAAKGLSRWVR